MQPGRYIRGERKFPASALDLEQRQVDPLSRDGLTQRVCAPIRERFPQLRRAHHRAVQAEQLRFDGRGCLTSNFGSAFSGLSHG